MNLVIKNLINSHKGRVIFACVIPIFVLAILFFTYSFRDFFKCPFYVFTGLYCPGCGSGRTMICLLHFDFTGALKHNILAVIALPLVAYYSLKVYLDIVFKKGILPLFKTSVKAYNITIASILVYGVLRNIPFYPFSILAP